MYRAPQARTVTAASDSWPICPAALPPVAAGILNSRILSGLRVPLLLIALEATAVCAYESALKNGLLPAFCQTFQVGMGVCACGCRWDRCLYTYFLH